MLNARAYERELKPLLNQAGAYARSIVGNHHDAEDAVQQAALRGWQSLVQYDHRRPFRGWWFAILRNCCIDMLRRSAKRATTPLGTYDPPDERQGEQLDWQGLDQALLLVSEAHREILRLKYFAELSYQDIAEVLAIPRGTVMSRLHLARKALAATLPKEEA